MSMCLCERDPLLLPHHLRIVVLIDSICWWQNKLVQSACMKLEWDALKWHNLETYYCNVHHFGDSNWSNKRHPMHILRLYSIDLSLHESLTRIKSPNKHTTINAHLISALFHPDYLPCNMKGKCSALFRMLPYAPGCYAVNSEPNRNEMTHHFTPSLFYAYFKYPIFLKMI